MCIRPNTLDDGTAVGCRECWQCRKRKVSDIVGRCIAESKYSVATYGVTLTYDANQGVNAVTLVYSDVQKFLKRLRFAGYNVRYLVCGEYGSQKGRAHWHIVLFFKNKKPDVELDRRVNWEFWKHGYSYFQKPDWRGIQYVVKYVLKNKEARSVETHLAMSKQRVHDGKRVGAPLGYEFFDELADEYVKQQLVPQNYFYKFKDVVDSKNRKKLFMMRGKTADNFMARFLKGWNDNYSTVPKSLIIEEYEDRMTNIEYSDEEMMKRIHDQYKAKYYSGFDHENIWQREEEEKNWDWYVGQYQGIPFELIDNHETVDVLSEGKEWRNEERRITDELKRHASKRKFYEKLQAER